MSQKSITSFFKPTNASKRSLESSNDSNNQNKKAKVEESFDDQIIAQIKRQSQLTPALSTTIGPSWFRALKSEFSKEYFRKLSDFLKEERRSRTIYPPEHHVYSWTMMCDIRDIKVVILGQDPYHGPKQAHGLAFSVLKGVSQPPSLINIFKELSNDIPNFKAPNHGDLSGWGEQGVLLLNACLTVQSGNANSHANKGWEQLTDATIKWINTNLDHVVFLLWGSYAQKKGSFIDKKKHLVLQTVHPSPLSAHRGFIGCGHFSKANEYLKKHNKKVIDWTELP